MDDISAGTLVWEDVLQDFWGPFNGMIKDSESLKVIEVLDLVEQDLFKFVFKGHKGGPISCKNCKDGEMRLRLGRYGPFLSCSNYPECKTIQNLNEDESSSDKAIGLDETLGQDPETQEEIYIKKGPFGYYFQWGTGKVRTSVPKNFSPWDLSVKDAVVLKNMPFSIGLHSDGEDILVGAGRFGPYLKHKDRFYGIKDYERFWSIPLENAQDIIKKAPPAKPSTRKFSIKKKQLLLEKKQQSQHL